MDYFFRNSLGFSLAARFVLPSGSGPFPCVIFAHGFDSSRGSIRSVPVAEGLADIGIASFLIDFTGHGESEGGKEESTIEQQTDDLRNALNFAQTLPKVDEAMLALHGSSSGSLVCLNLLLNDNRPKTAVLRAPRINGYFPLVKESAPKLRIPLFFIQGEKDLLLTETIGFIDKLQTESELVVIPQADHLFTNPAHLSEVIKLSINWFDNELHMEKAA